jgi:hypothetical protein
MASTTEQRIDVEAALHACLEAGDDPDELKDQAEAWIDEWAAEQEAT